MTKQKFTNYATLVKLISNQSDYPQYIVKDILRSLAIVVPQELLQDKKVKIEGLGTLSIKKSIKRNFVSMLTGVSKEQWTRATCSLKADGYLSNALNPEVKTDVESIQDKQIEE